MERTEGPSAPLTVGGVSTLCKVGPVHALEERIERGLTNCINEMVSKTSQIKMVKSIQKSFYLSVHHGSRITQVMGINAQLDTHSYSAHLKGCASRIKTSRPQDCTTVLASSPPLL